MRFPKFSLFLMFFTSCSVGPSYIPPYVDVPSEWKNKEQCESFRDSADLDYWWQVFDDPKLEELELLALENNRDLFVALERIKEARALMGIAASAFYPQINISPQYANVGELIKTYKAPGVPSVGPNVFRAHELLYFLPVTLSYEVDLWGKIKDQYDSAKYDWFAQEKDMEVVMLSLTSNLAISYYQLRALDSQIDLLSKILKTRQKAFEINKARYEEEIIFYADVTLAAEEVDRALVQYNEAERQRNVIENQIAVLIGSPASEFCLESMPLVGLPPCIPSGLPSEILLRRPDVVEAEYNVRSSHALVKYAYSLFFPSLTLTAAGGFESPIFKDFLQWISRYWMLGAQSNQIVFDGLKTPYYLDSKFARFFEASGEYQQQILIAFKEVETALSDIESYATQYDLAVTTAQWAQKTYQLYLDRYTLGVINYIDVANTENDLLNFQIDANTLQGFRYISTIQLIKALGGGWSSPGACNPSSI